MTPAGADPFESPRFVRAYIVTYWLQVGGLGAAVAGVPAGFLFAPLGALLFIVGWIAFMIGIVWSNAAAYRVLRGTGRSRYYAWMNAGPSSWPSWKRCKRYRVLRDQTEMPSSDREATP